MRVALVQMTGSDDPAANLVSLLRDLDQAAAGGARLILTPEVTNCISTSRARQNEVLTEEGEDPMLGAVRDWARGAGCWVLLGSLAVKTSDPDGRFANRSILIDPQGQIAARYDKMHMFDVTISQTERYEESKGYRPGTAAVVAPVDDALLGLTICYDLRFPGLYRDLALAGAQILTVPSAFARATGKAHWETLLRARAVECGAYVLAPAQTGTHPSVAGSQRKTHGSSMAIDPFGTVILDAGQAPGVAFCDIDLAEVDRARSMIPSLSHERAFEGPR